MSRYVLSRLLQMIPVIVGVTVLTFILANLLPGDPALAAAGRDATREQIETVRKQLGLDQPLPVQYWRYLERLARGDLGRSITSQQSVRQELSIYFPATLELTLVAMILSIALGLPLGVMTGVGKSRWVNSSVMLVSLVGIGMPVFWAGLVFQLIFYGKLNILPLSGRLGTEFIPPPPVTNMYTVDAVLAGQWATLADALKHMVLPAFTLAVGRVATIARLTHASVLNVMRRDYIRTARAKGLRERFVIARHVLKNAMIPIVTTISLQFGWLLSGSILVENIFTWGGLGTYAWIGIFRLDIPVVMGVTLITTMIFLMANLLTDLAYGFIDPRISYG